MELDWTLPYASRRVPVFARNIVSTSQPLAAQAGLDALRRGGNAVDAALTAAITLTVVEPCSNGIGSDAFALVWDGERIHGMNGSGRSPSSWTPDRFRDSAGIEYGWDAITVPGAVDAWTNLSKRFGVLPFADLFEPAIRYASEGFVVSPTIHRSWSEAVETYAEYPCFQQAFAPGGRAPEISERFMFPDQAETLRQIAESGGEAFYRGALTKRMVEYLEPNGCAISLEDFAGHKTDWVEPIGITYAGATLLEIPPNGQGIASLIALGILKHLDLEAYPLDSADSVHYQVEATRIGLNLAHAHVADPDYMQMSPDELLDESLLEKYAEMIRPDAVLATADIPRSGGTVYLTTADQNGMMVSFIQSNFDGFGSGIVVPGTGISLQNRAAGFSLDQDHPNAVAGSKRPFHTIIPGFVMRDGAPLMSFGVMGGHMQAQGHVQMMVRVFTYNQNPQAASDAPRWYIDEHGDLVFEEGFDEAVVRDLTGGRGHVLSGNQPRFAFGGAQLIYRLDDGSYCAGSDHRKDGQAVGF